MAIKTKTYGRALSPAEMSGWSRFVYTDGSVGVGQVGSLAPAYYRRFGRASIISSQDGTDGRFRPVSHTSETYVANPLSGMQPYLYGERNKRAPSSSTVWKVYLYNLQRYVHGLRYANFENACNSVSLSTATVQWSSLAATALDTMLPTFAAGNSYLNYLYEFKDFKKIMQGFTLEFGKKLDSMALLVGFKRSDKPLKKLSSAYLMYSFGWGPLYRDILRFVETLSGFCARFDELLRREGSPQQSYWGTTIAGTATNENISFLDNGDGPLGGWVGPFLGEYCTLVSTLPSTGMRYSATVRYRYRMPDDIRSNVGVLKAALDTLGVSRNPAILWNAIPFSFIVDWFFNVSGTLNRMRVDNIDIKTEILDFCHSVKYEKVVQMSMRGTSWTEANGYKYQTWGVTDSCVKTVYERRTGIPNLLAAIQTSGLNARKFSLAAALANANTKTKR